MSETIGGCPGCALPRLFRWYLSWEDNGTIAVRLDRRLRVALVESALLDEIYRRIEEMMGFGIGGIVFEAERAAAKVTIDALVPRGPGPLVRNRALMHPVTRFFQTVSRIAGLGDFQTVFYRVRKGSMARVRNPVNRDIMAAMVVGAFESAEGVVYDSTWVELGSELYFLIMPAGGKPEIAARMAPEITDPLPGNRRLAKCPRCGLPEELRHLRWSYRDALIIDSRRDVRMSFINGYSFSSVFRELVKELGEDIVALIIEASREFTLREIEQTRFLEVPLEGGSAYSRFLDLLPLYGHGNPVSHVHDGGSLAVTIENPYSAYLLAGQLLAVHEAVTGRRGNASIDEPAPNRARISISGQV